MNSRNIPTNRRLISDIKGRPQTSIGELDTRWQQQKAKPITDVRKPERDVERPRYTYVPPAATLYEPLSKRSITFMPHKYEANKGRVLAWNTPILNAARRIAAPIIVLMAIGSAVVAAAPIGQAPDQLIQPGVAGTPKDISHTTTDTPKDTNNLNAASVAWWPSMTTKSNSISTMVSQVSTPSAATNSNVGSLISDIVPVPIGGMGGGESDPTTTPPVIDPPAEELPDEEPPVDDPTPPETDPTDEPPATTPIIQTPLIDIVLPVSL